MSKRHCPVGNFDPDSGGSPLKEFAWLHVAVSVLLGRTVRRQTLHCREWEFLRLIRLLSAVQRRCLGLGLSFLPGPSSVSLADFRRKVFSYVTPGQRPKRTPLELCQVDFRRRVD